MKTYSRQPFGNPNLPKKAETSSAPKKSSVREQCKNMFLDALKETPNYPDGNFLNKKNYFKASFRDLQRIG